MSFHGEAYEHYRQEVPMVVPVPGKRYEAPVSGSESAMQVGIEAAIGVSG